MEYVQSWITSETNDNLRTPADVIEFYKSLGDGSRFSLEELAELTDIEQLNVCQIIIDAAKDNGIEL